MDISIQTLHKYVEKIAKKVLNDESSKPVISGTIKSSLPGIYEVQLVNGNETSLVRAESLYADKTFAVDDYVYLVRAENNRGDEYETKYFIVGLVTTVEQNFANLTEWERFLGDGQKINPTFDTKITDANFINAVRANGVFSFSAKVSTKITEQTDFGFKFTFTFDDDTTKEESFPGITFVGQPWNLNEVTQKKIFDLGTQNTLKSITIAKEGPTGEAFTVEDVSLESGTFLDLAQDFKVTLENVNGKNYFNKSTDDRAVQIKANVNYGNQKLDTKALKYYWFVKKDNATKINSLGGNGWECLNDSRPAKIIDETGVKVKEDVLIYKTDDNILEITYDDANNVPEQIPDGKNEKDFKNWLPHYENEIKCVVGYQLANATSEPIKIYNFNHESYEVTIEKISGENPILYANETIILTAKVSSKTIGGTFSFEWYNKNGKLKYVASEEKDENGTVIKENLDGYYENTLTISGDSTKKSKSDLYVMAAANETFHCRLIVNGNDFGKSNEYTVVSRAGETQILEDTFNYKYWINEANNIRFISEEKEETVYIPNSEGIVEEFEDGDKYLEYKTESGTIGKDANSLEWLNGTGPFAKSDTDKSYYLYYSEQKIVVDKDRVDEQNKKLPIRFDDYSKPKILRQVFINPDGTITNIQSTGSIEKLNTFNDLTDGGRTQGIRYEDATYSEATTFDKNKLNTGEGYYKKVDTYKYISVGKLENFETGIVYYYTTDNGETYKEKEEETPVKDRVYYTYELVKTDYILRPQDGDNYALDTKNKPAGFKPGEKYYEQNGGDLYINASFIRSGHLEVSNGEKTVFFADFDSGIVQIGTGSVSGLDSSLSLLKTNILNAQNTANGAQTTADKAQTTANGAQTTADKAQTTANGAQTTANGAQTAADKAQTTANGAQTAADKAQTTAETALTNFTSTFVVTDDIIYANAGKTLYLGSGEGRGDLIIDTEALKFNIKNNNKLEITGNITATGGTIGGFHITEDHLGSGEVHGTDDVLISPNYNEFAFWAGSRAVGSEDDSTRPFWVKTDGSVRATKLIISQDNVENLTDTLDTINLNVNAAKDSADDANKFITANFLVDKYPNSSNKSYIYMQANDLIINSDKLKLNHNGTSITQGFFSINTTPLTLKNIADNNGNWGSLAGFTLKSNSISKETNEGKIYLGTDKISLGKEDNFKVDDKGVLTAQNFSLGISGKTFSTYITNGNVRVGTGSNFTSMSPDKVLIDYTGPYTGLEIKKNSFYPSEAFTFKGALSFENEVSFNDGIKSFAIDLSATTTSEAILVNYNASHSKVCGLSGYVKLSYGLDDPMTLYFKNGILCGLETKDDKHANMSGDWVSIT